MEHNGGVQVELSTEHRLNFDIKQQRHFPRDYYQHLLVLASQYDALISWRLIPIEYNSTQRCNHRRRATRSDLCYCPRLQKWYCFLYRRWRIGTSRRRTVCLSAANVNHTNQVSCCQPATPEQWQMCISSGIRWTLRDCCFLSTQNYNFSFQDAHSVSPSPLLVSDFALHTPSEGKLLSDHMSRVLRYDLLLFFYLNCDHGRFSVWSGWISLYDCKLPALNKLQSLDSLGLCLVLITNRWLAGAICWYQSFSFAGDDACGSVCVLINEQWWMWSCCCCCYYYCTLMNCLLSTSLFRS